jgi:hypothetical protein
MIGISNELLEQLRARGHSDIEIARLFGPRAHKGELRIVYQRQNGVRTSPLPSSRHMCYVSRGMTAVAIAEDVEPPRADRDLTAAEAAIVAALGSGKR